MKRRWRELILIGLIVLSLALLMFLEPIKQDLSYHDFADRRTFFGIPNFFDVMTNLLFAVAGVMGLAWVHTHKPKIAPRSWLVFFIGVTVVGPGSAYYHWSPDNATLVWDRLPMTAGFMGLFVGLLSEYVNTRIERYLLIPAVIFGLATVIYWHFFDDLRLYFWTQFATLVIISLIVIIYQKRYTNQRYLVYAFALYGLAKLVEICDTQVFVLSGSLLSGHSLKHILAALATFSIYLMLRKRTPVAINGS